MSNDPIFIDATGGLTPTGAIEFTCEIKSDPEAGAGHMRFSTVDSLQVTVTIPFNTPADAVMRVLHALPEVAAAVIERRFEALDSQAAVKRVHEASDAESALMRLLEDDDS